MIELSDLINKTDRELKICIKNHIIDNDFNLNWTDIFAKYFVYMKINRQQNEVNIFRDLCLHKKENINLLDNCYINKIKDYIINENPIVNSVQIYWTLYMKLCIKLKAEYNSREYEEYYLFENENIIKILEFLFSMLKEVIKTKTNDYLDELTDFFAEINEEERKVQNDNFFKKLDNKLW